MTIKELSQLYYLNLEIETDQKRLVELQARATSPSVPGLDGMPRSRSFDSAVERIAVEIASIEKILAEKQQRCISERNRLERFISDIDDSLLRMIFRLRFVDGLDWLEVARCIGGGNTAKNTSLQVYRYLKKVNALTK